MQKNRGVIIIGSIHMKHIKMNSLQPDIISDMLLFGLWHYYTNERNPH